jgi:hypothetical protein
MLEEGELRVGIWWTRKLVARMFNLRIIIGASVRDIRTLPLPIVRQSLKLTSDGAFGEI